MRHKVAEPGELQEGGRKIATVNGMEIGVFLVEGRHYAWRNVCPHAAAPVCVGVVQGTRLQSEVYCYEYGMDNRILRCPWHGWEFDLTSGKHLGEGKVGLRGFPVETDETGIYIILRDKQGVDPNPDE